MPTPHSSVQYVEPNSDLENISNYSEYITTDGRIYDKIINPEDYCIGLSITAELCNRGQSLASGSQALILSWENLGEDSKVNFMSGTLVPSVKNDSIQNNLNIPYLTTNYADMYVTDIVDYGTTEMIGIKSVNIDFENAVLPVITVKFTDVRGMSLFTPREFSDLKDLHSSGKISKENAAQAFFQCFFKFPYPKFTITVKGFYGRPVSYEVTCDKFDTDFNSETGDFDVTVRFIGYKYSFLSDITTELLLTAPYTDYLGQKYWEQKTSSLEFSVTDSFGQKVPMPTLVDIRNRIKNILTNSEVNSDETTLTREDDTHDEERRQLEAIKNTYPAWYTQLEKEVYSKYGKENCFINKLNSGEYERIIVLIGKDNKSKDLSEDASQFSNEMKKVNNDLYALIEEYNEKFPNIEPLKKLSKDYSAYLNVPLFNLVTKNDRGSFTFNGYADGTPIPKSIADVAIMNRIGTDDEQNIGTAAIHQKTLKTVYNDGSNQKTNCFNINVDYTVIQKRIDKLTADANKSYNEKKKQKDIHNKNIKLIKELGFNPTISNFTKIVMAHLETLMYMVHTVSDEIKNDSTRTPSSIAMSVGINGNLSDIKEGYENVPIPPFPRVTETVTEEDGTQKQQDVWIGKFDKDQLKEVDLVETFFNGTELIRQLINTTDEMIETTKNDRTAKEQGVERSSVRYPLTSYDFFLDSNVYGSDVIESTEKLAGAVSIRMFDILSLNFFANEFNKKEWHGNADKLGRCEAHNFYKSVDTTANNNLRDWIRLDTGIFNSDYIIKMVTSTDRNNRYPWSFDTIDKDTRTTPKALFTNDWLFRYKYQDNRYKYDGNAFMYPVQNISFETIDNDYKLFGNSGDNVSNHNVILSQVPTDMDAFTFESYIDEYNGHYNLIICDDFIKVENMMNTAMAESFDSYGDISNKIVQSCSLDNAMDVYYKGMFKENGISSFCKRNDKYTSANTLVLRASVSDAFPLYGRDGKVMKDGDGNFERFTSSKEDLSAYFDSEIKGKYINSCFLGEIFGYNKENKLDNNSTILLDGSLTPEEFIMGIDCLNYKALDDVLCMKDSGARTFAYIPRFLVLQLGSVLTQTIVNENSINSNITIGDDIKIHHDLKPIAEKYLNAISIYSRMVLMKYYKDWTKNEFNNIKSNLSGKNRSKNVAFIIEGGRTLLNQDSTFVKDLTNKMMLPVLMINGNVNHFVNSERKPLSYSDYKVKNNGIFKNYLDGFIDELNMLLGVDYKADENGNMVRRSAEATNTSDEMRMELYRYLKQIYDKWIPTSNFDDWKYEKFFDGNGDYRFYFIDSYYNKIGDKLLLNPKKIYERIETILSYSDISSNMLSLLSYVYTDNRCMFKCIQNFIDLSKRDAMEDMFKPLPYSMAFGNNKKASDFVIVYTYEPSKALDVSSNEYADDSFMLNDEFNSPTSIRTRGASGNFYSIPAFGVTYGKQYQSFFKKVSVNTKNSIQTEQSIKAKHAILRGLTNKNKNGAQGQDMFDLYTSQSYTCTVEMMGCAWVQPMMYFVLLNVPMFRGSYMIMKVNHTITPGNMTTTFTGCRMSKVGNRFVEDVFINSDGDDTQYIGSDNVTFDNAMANTDNDCPYAVFPIFSNNSKLTELKRIIRKWEGGYAGNIDGATCTMRGITLATFRQYYGKNKNCNDLKNITEDQWDNIFKQSFWDKWKADQINNVSIANLLVDWSFNSGCYGFYYPQDILGTSRSCSATNADINAINSYPNQSELFQKLWNRRKQQYESIGKGDNAKFLKGWLNRLNDFKYFESPTTNNEEEISKMNEDIYEPFFSAINQTAQNTESMKFELKHEYFPNKESKNKLMMISAASTDNNPKLSKVFDCILNTPEYFRYVKALYWVYDNAVNTIVRVDVRLDKKDVPTNQQRVWLYNKGTRASNPNKDVTYNKIKVEDLSDDAKKSFSKRYKADGENNFKLLVQGISDPEKFGEIGISDCASVDGGGSVGNLSGFEGTVNNPLMKKVLARVNEICLAHKYNNASSWYTVRGANGNKPPSPTGQCTYGPSTWYHEAGNQYDLHFYPGPKDATYRNTTLKNYGFKLVWHGTVKDALALSKSNFRPGDVSTQYYYLKGKKSAHGCMYTGKDWRSDFIQSTIMSSRSAQGREGNYSVCIWRHPAFQEDGKTVVEVT